MLCPALAFRGSLAERLRSAGHRVCHQSGSLGSQVLIQVWALTLLAEIVFISVSLNVHTYEKMLLAF